MNTVNELKKLLKLDVEKIRANLLEASTLESLNRQSEALNQLVLSGGGGGDTDQEDTDCEIVFEGGGGSAKEAGSSASHHHHHQKQKQDGLEISPGVDGTRVKTFEDLVKLKLQQGEQQQQQQQQIQQLRQRNPFKVQSAEKRPFLRRGEGLRRFSKGGGEITSPKNGKKTEASPKTTKSSSLERPPLRDNTSAFIIEKAPTPKTNVKPKNQCEVITECLAGKAQLQLRREDLATEKCTKKRADFARKVLPISRTTQQMTENVPGATETAPPSLSTVEVVRQIAHLEKRLLDLMTLKGQLTEERIFELRDTGESDATTDKKNATEHLASSIELIRGEIAALNTKVSSLATTGKSGGGGGEVEEEEEEDKNSRHLEDAAEEVSRTAATSTTATSASESAPESSISTTSLSNGDKIAFASDQSITYVHGNGTSQTLYRDGLRVIRFPNGQVERLHPDGSKEITYADGQPVHRRLVIKRKTGGGQEDNSEEIIHLADGTVHSTTTDGCERIIYPNGDVEWRTEDYTRRHFSSGHIKTQYGNGCSETIFSNGRVRLKDRQGNVLFDRRP